MQQSVMAKHHSLNFNFKAVARVPALTFNFGLKEKLAASDVGADGGVV